MGRGQLSFLRPALACLETTFILRKFSRKLVYCIWHHQGELLPTGVMDDHIKLSHPLTGGGHVRGILDYLSTGPTCGGSPMIPRSTCRHYWQQGSSSMGWPASHRFVCRRRRVSCQVS